MEVLLQHNRQLAAQHLERPRPDAMEEQASPNWLSSHLQDDKSGVGGPFPIG
jgi:hypothetical protein